MIARWWTLPSRGSETRSWMGSVILHCPLGVYHMVKGFVREARSDWVAEIEHMHKSYLNF